MARIYKNGLEHTCDQCGLKITHADKPNRYGYTCWPRFDKKYCSSKCRQKAFRLRQRLARQAAKKRPSRATRVRSVTRNA